MTMLNGILIAIVVTLCGLFGWKFKPKTKPEIERADDTKIKEELKTIDENKISNAKTIESTDTTNVSGGSNLLRLYKKAFSKDSKSDTDN